MPPASGWYAEWPFSGLSQTIARDLRCRRRHRLREEGGVAPLPAVRRDNDDRAARHPAAAVDAVEGVERLADAGAAGPVAHRLRGPLERAVGVAAVEERRQVGEPRAERERLDLPARWRPRPAGTAPARGRTAPSSPEMSQMNTTRRSTSFWWRKARSIGSPSERIERRIVRRGSISSPPCDGSSRRERRFGRFRASRSQARRTSRSSARAHLGEVLRAQQLGGREGRGRELGVVGVDRVHRDLGDRVGGDGARLRLHVDEPEVDRPLAEVLRRRPLEPGPERAVEDLEVVVLRDQRAGQRGVDVVAHRQVDRIERAERVLQAARADLDAGLAQDPAERDELADDGIARLAMARHRPSQRGLRLLDDAGPGRRRAPSRCPRGTSAPSRAWRRRRTPTAPPRRAPSAPASSRSSRRRRAPSRGPCVRSLATKRAASSASRSGTPGTRARTISISRSSSGCGTHM